MDVVANYILIMQTLIVATRYPAKSCLQIMCHELLPNKKATIRTINNPLVDFYEETNCSCQEVQNEHGSKTFLQS